MKVSELIEELKKMPQDFRVITKNFDNEFTELEKEDINTFAGYIDGNNVFKFDHTYQDYLILGY